MAPNILYSVIGATLIAVVVYIVNARRIAAKYKLPPLVEGGVPLFGNALQLPPLGHEMGVVTKQWAEKYGEMCLPHPTSQFYADVGVQVHRKDGRNKLGFPKFLPRSK
jgi:hypothetical protein